MAMTNKQIAELNAEMADGILIEIRDLLTELGCCHDKGTHAATPPMMFREWIICTMAKARKDERERLNDCCPCFLPSHGNETGCTREPRFDCKCYARKFPNSYDELVECVWPGHAILREKP